MTERPQGTSSRIEILARPGSRNEALKWDEWRRRWIISVREKAEDGRANEAILRVLSARLQVPPGSIRWVISGKSKMKVAEVDGLDEIAVRAKLGASLR